MADKYFPIKTDTACQLKWTWSTIHLFTGETRSCHRVKGDSVTPENFSSFHNTPKKINDRQLMLKGQWPDGGCSYCKNMEEAGGQSDRQFHLQIPNQVPPELDSDLQAIIVTPRILEVYLDNVCNMSCIYCWDGFSSRIQSENNKFGPFELNDVSIVNTAVPVDDRKEMDRRFWCWLTENYQSLHRLNVLGGEPFFQHQFDTMLEFLENNTNPNLEFNIVTNLKVPQEKLEHTMNRLKHLVDNKKIKRVDITCSIDCWGSEQEYIRHGIDLTQWQTAFEYMVEQTWLRLNINQAVTGLGIKSMPQLIDYINQQRKYRPIYHYHMAVVNIPFLNPTIFGANTFNDDFNAILDAMPSESWDDKNSFDMMKTLKLQCQQSQRNIYELSRLKTYLTELDRRRGTSWQQTFPWLVSELENVV